MNERNNRAVGMKYTIGIMSVIVLMTGCRTYGEYNSEEQIREQMNEANREFTQQLETARSFYADLQRTRGGDSANALVQSFGHTLRQHEAILQRHETWAKEAENGGNHQYLKRHYGAIIMEQQVVRDRYQKLLNTTTGVDLQTVTGEENVVYRIVPPNYARSGKQRGELSLAAPSFRDSTTRITETVSRDSVAGMHAPAR